MKKIVLMLLMTVSAHAGMNIPSNSVSLMSAVNTSQTIIFVPTLTPVPSGAYGASIISGNVPYNSGLDQYIEPIWVISGNNHAITVSRGTRATANPQGTWTVSTPQPGLIIGHTIRTMPRLLYYAGTATVTNTPTFTFTVTPTKTMTPVATATTSNWSTGPVAVIAGGAITSVQNLTVPGTVFSDALYTKDGLYAIAQNTDGGHLAFGNNGHEIDVVGAPLILATSVGTSILLSATLNAQSNKIVNIPTPINSDDASSKSYTDALSGTTPPTPGPRRVGDIYVNTSGSVTTYIGTKVSTPTWKQINP